MARVVGAEAVHRQHSEEEVVENPNEAAAAVENGSQHQVAAGASDCHPLQAAVAEGYHQAAAEGVQQSLKHREAAYASAQGVNVVFAAGRPCNKCCGIDRRGVVL